jgi:tetratricopeptide (TPR) repeat protein
VTSACDLRVAEPLLEWLERGQEALESGRFGDAITSFGNAQRLLPTDVSIAIALANVHRLAGDTVMTRSTLQTAHRDGNWSDASVAFALGSALLDAGAPAEAASCFEHVLKSMPGNSAALGALAGARRTMGEPAAAWPLIQRALARASSDPALLLTAAQIRHELGDLPGALTWLNRADAVRPQHGPTQLQRAFTTLLHGPSAEGWRLFESRALPVPATNAKPWRGEALNGGSVLVTAEQGVGDQFQFARFIPLLLERGAGGVTVECHADAVSLFTANGWNAIGRGTQVSTDWHVPMLSLPHWLALNDYVAGDRVPYLRAPHASAPSAGITRRFGLVWAGNPAFPGRVTRDLDPALLPGIVGISGIEWISLQHGDAGMVEIGGLTRLPLRSDWAATANTLASLDGLVTTDTGVAHLAGAMGIPTWVMLQHVPDWRWGLKGESTPWYPTVHLVRQPQARDWKHVVQSLRAQLASMTP